MIRQYFHGRCLLVTGGTGFVGQALIAKVLTDLGDEVERVYALIRPRRRTDGRVIAPAQRLQDLWETSLFAHLRTGDARRWQMLRAKVVPIAIDERRDDLGLAPADRQRIVADVDTIINCAATVVFDEPLNVSVQANIAGPMALMRLAHAAAGDVHFVHISTAYVNGQRSGIIADEELPPDRDMRQVIDGTPPAFDPVADVEECRAVCHSTEQASRTPAQMRRFKREILAQYKGLSRKLTKSRLERLTEERRQRWVERQLVDEGMRRARAHGWNDVYTYTKAVGEQMLSLHRDRVPLVIVRPSIIESSLQEPEPGWITGLKVMDPLLAAYGRGLIPDFPARRDIVLDLIPVDRVVNTALAAASTATPGRVQVYHVATGDENPVRVHELFDIVRTHFLDAPMLDRTGAAPKLPQWRYPSLRTFRLLFHLFYMWPVQLRLWLADHLPLHTPSTRQRRYLGTARVRLQRVLYYTDIYHPYTNLDCRFRTRATRNLFEALPAREQRDFNLDVRDIDWPHYIGQVHLPGMRRHVLREETLAEAVLPESPQEPGDSEERWQAESEIHTLADLLRWSCERHAPRVALQIQRGGRWQQLTYAALAAAVEERAARWQALGLMPAQRLLLQGDNSPEWVVSYFAATTLALAVVPVDTQTPSDEIERLVEYVDGRALVATPAVLASVEMEQELLRIDLLTGLVDPSAPPQPSPSRREPEVSPAMEASIIFTSGTRVDPRGVVLTHANFIADLLALAEIQPVTEEDRILSLLPLHHGLEFTGGLLMSLWGGATTTFVDTLNSRRILELMTATATTAMITVPRLLQLLVDRLRRVAPRGAGGSGPAAEALANLRLVVSGGAPLGEGLFDACADLGITVYEGYGLTETAPIVTVNPAGGPRPGSVGQPLPGIDVRIAGAVSAGDTGEILVRGANVMAGYLGRRELTDRVLVDGWLHTGDIGRFDGDGFLYLVGRTKSLILTGAGKNVYPEEVEALYGDLPQVAEFAVVGVPSPRTGGEEVRGVAVLTRQAAQADAAAAESRLREHLYARARELPTYQRIQRLHVRRRPLPRLDDGRTDRLALAAELDHTPEGGADVVDLAPWERPVYDWLRHHAGLAEAEIHAHLHAPLDTLLDSLMAVEFAAWLAPWVGGDGLGGLDRSRVCLADLLRRWRGCLSAATDLASSLEAPPGHTYWHRVVNGEPRDPIRTGGTGPALRRFFWSVGSAPLRRYLALQVEGAEHLPAEGPFLLAANHVSDLDAVAVRLSLGDARDLAVAVEGRARRRGGERTMWSCMLGAVHLDRSDGIEASLQALAAHLRAGVPVLLFPEGEYPGAGHLRGFKSGIGLLALELECAVLPVHITGSAHAPPGSRRPRRHPVRVRFGAAVDPAAFRDLPGRSAYERYRELTEAIRDRIAELGGTRAPPSGPAR